LVDGFGFLTESRLLMRHFGARSMAQFYSRTDYVSTVWAGRFFSFLPFSATPGEPAQRNQPHPFWKANHSAPPSFEDVDLFDAAS
jgi:hypothetical protein